MPVWSGKKKGIPLYTRPNQKDEIAGLTVQPAAQKCENWSWASGLEALLQMQKVPLRQTYWILKAYPGELCIDQPVDFDKLVKWVNGDYVLDDGRKVRLEASYVLGAPTVTDDIIAPIRRGEPVLLFWKSHAYVLVGIMYDEQIYPNGQREFIIHELRLIDPYTPSKPVTFVNGTDDPNDINGFFQVAAIFEKRQPWIR